MNLPYADLRELVTDIRNRHFPGFHVLPYNRFDIRGSDDWWILPTSDKVAYRFGKLSETFYRDEGGLLAEFKLCRNLTEFAEALCKLDGKKVAWFWGGISIGK